MDKLEITNENGKWSIGYNGDSNMVDFFSNLSGAFEGLFEANDKQAKFIYNCFVAMIFEVAFSNAEAQSMIDQCSGESKKATETFLKDVGLL